nr:hypothetical protein [Mycobacterium sp. UM_NZ2]
MATDPDVLGYISQCAICPQTALTRTAHPANDRFICPRCREVVGEDITAASVTR